MIIIPNSSLDRSDFSLAEDLDQSITMRDVIRRWPDAEIEGYYSPAEGYYGIEAGFSTPNGDFYIYARWGNVHLACRGGWRNPHAKAWADEINAILMLYITT